MALDDTLISDTLDAEIADLEARLLEVENFRQKASDYLALRSLYASRQGQIALMSKQEPQEAVRGPEERRARVYKMAMNPALRFLEFEDGSRGVLRVRIGHNCKVNWEVDVVPGEQAELWYLAGRYNRWGTRCA